MEQRAADEACRHNDRERGLVGQAPVAAGDGRHTWTPYRNSAPAGDRSDVRVRRTTSHAGGGTDVHVGISVGVGGQ